MIVGLTGGIGSGKTTVANMFKHFNNICVYVADVEAKKLMHSSLKIQNAIVAQFGKAAYTNNTLNSAYLANIVFNNKQQLAKLNAIIHPEVKQHFKNICCK
jgi:Dephospho-CoA kinase